MSSAIAAMSSSGPVWMLDRLSGPRCGAVCDHLAVVINPVPSYDDLILLFEDESTYRYADEEGQAGYQFDWRELWPYTAVTFRTQRAGIGIEMYIEPGYNVVRLRLTGDGTDIVDLELRDVRSVGVKNINGRGLLRLDFPDITRAAAL